MNGEDWTSYEVQPAPPALLCQFRERGSDLVFVDYAKDFSPTVAVGCLEWKLTGIAREELDQMPEEVKRQVMPQAGNWARMLLSPIFPLGLLFSAQEQFLAITSAAIVVS